MSNITIRDFVKSGVEALNNKNYIAALFIAISLPSICAKKDFENNNMEHKNEKEKYKESDFYKKWCDNYLNYSEHITDECSEEKKIYIKQLLQQKNIDSIYSLRCNLVHEGEISINNNKEDSKNYFFGIGAQFPHTVSENKVLTNIEELCKEIFAACIYWCNERKNDDIIISTIFMHDNKEDIKQYIDIFINRI